MLHVAYTDWALLNTQLNFVYLDPVLASHLQEQADLLIGRSLLAFVHPDEQASAEQDLGGVLDSRTLHGSVTRYVQSLSDCSPCRSLARSLNSFLFSSRSRSCAASSSCSSSWPLPVFCVCVSPVSLSSVRYSRLSRVRRQLGYQGPGPSWQDADKIAVDANYMAVDIVINWAADGVVLCFIHAVVDLTPRDNDEHNKTGWTNWFRA